MVHTFMQFDNCFFHINLTHLELDKLVTTVVTISTDDEAEDLHIDITRYPERGSEIEMWYSCVDLSQLNLLGGERITTYDVHPDYMDDFISHVASIDLEFREYLLVIWSEYQDNE